MVNYDLLDQYKAKFGVTFTVVAQVDNPKVNDFLAKALESGKPISDRDFGINMKAEEGETIF